MDKISWLQYLVSNNPYGANRVLVRHGYYHPQNIDETFEACQIFIEDNGEEGILELMSEAHPDLAILEEASRRNANGNPASPFFGATGDGLSPESQWPDTTEILGDAKQRASDTGSQLKNFLNGLRDDLNINKEKMQKMEKYNLKQKQWINVLLFAGVGYIILKFID